MSRTLQILVGIIAIVGGATLFAMHVGEFSEHLQMNDHAVAHYGFVTEVNKVGGKSELHYEFWKFGKTKRYAGMSVLEGTGYDTIVLGTPTPIDYMEGNPEVNRSQLARPEIYTRGRNVAVGALLVLIGLALIARAFQSSKTATASESAEATS